MRAHNDHLCRRTFLTKAMQTTVATVASAGMGPALRHCLLAPASRVLRVPPGFRTTATARSMSMRSASPREDP